MPQSSSQGGATVGDVHAMVAGVAPAAMGRAQAVVVHVLRQWHGLTLPALARPQRWPFHLDALLAYVVLATAALPSSSTQSPHG